MADSTTLTCPMCGGSVDEVHADLGGTCGPDCTADLLAARAYLDEKFDAVAARVRAGSLRTWTNY